ncbi:ABC transporter substrate-binding protein [Aeromicrobium halocynthiae]|uniref:ABC transporter substrate-binding protein n=1 Tax=Aeromicrobium halocynthiae TaxID=560557 RepID=A0ABN2W2E9_9ACTN
MSISRTHHVRSHRQSRWLATGLSTVVLGIAGCGADVTTTAADDGPTDEGYPVTITNCDRELTVDRAPESIVGLMPSQTELLVGLGLADRMVGQAQTGTYALPEEVAEQVADVSELSTDTPPAREELLEAAPDAVVAPTTYEFTGEQGFATLEQLEQAGVTSYVATGGCPERRNTAVVEDLLTDIENLGLIFGADAEAETLAGEVRGRLAAVDEAIDGADQPTVAQLYIEGTSVFAIGAGVEYDIIRRAGGDNVFTPDEDLFEQFFSAAISPEEVAARNPDAIVFTVADDAQEQRVRDYLGRTFPDVTAVAEDRLLAIPASDVFPGALGNVSAVESIAQVLHPDRF